MELPVLNGVPDKEGYYFVKLHNEGEWELFKVIEETLDGGWYAFPCHMMFSESKGTGLRLQKYSKGSSSFSAHKWSERVEPPKI